MILLAGICAAAGVYQVLALVACVSHLRRRDSPPSLRPGVSILKPVCGADDHFWPAIVSHANLQYPTFEILFGVREVTDSAIPFIERLQSEFPHGNIRLVKVTTETANAKVGALIDLAREAQYSTLVVNDSDILVPPDYLDRLVGALQDQRIGLVTCLYRAGADTFPSKWEALGIATDFAPSALVAPLVGVNEFGLGSTLALRIEDLDAIGGFESVGDHIADDYQLGKGISQSGKRVHMSGMPVETHLGSGTWKSVWEHQVRWARTIRLSRGAYLGLPVTNASLWAGCCTSRWLVVSCPFTLGASSHCWMRRRTRDSSRPDYRAPVVADAFARPVGIRRVGRRHDRSQSHLERQEPDSRQTGTHHQWLSAGFV